MSQRGSILISAALFVSLTSVVAMRGAGVLELAGAMPAEGDAALEAELAELRSENARLREMIRELQGELVRMTEDQFAREQQWLGFTRVIASLTSERLSPEELARVLGGPPRAERSDASAEAALAEPIATAAAQARDARSREIELALRSLLIAEQVDGLELLEAGQMGQGATGPVVFRQSDSEGRRIGSLSAERLRLEGSRSGRTLTIVLEEGGERRRGERSAFQGSAAGAERGGERRIVLAGVDPAPWIEACPELFQPGTRVELVDDGRWNTSLLQFGLNELLRQDAATGWYKLAALGGVLDGELCDVQLEEYDLEGRLQRRLFADRLRIEEQPRGMLILLEQGVQMRGGRRLAFLDGRFRIFLPRADHGEWRAMGLPGLVPVKDSPLARGSNAPLPAALSGRRP